MNVCKRFRKQQQQQQQNYNNNKKKNLKHTLINHNQKHVDDNNQMRLHEISCYSFSITIKNIRKNLVCQEDR